MHDIEYWLTSHNPHVGSAWGDYNLYLRPTDVSPERMPRKGDMGMIYEQFGGEVDGKNVTDGRGGIVIVTNVLSEWKPRKTTSEFTLEATCDLYPNADGFVPLADLLGVMEYDPAYTMNGFGGSTGLLRISTERFSRLFGIFKTNKRR